MEVVNKMRNGLLIQHRTIVVGIVENRSGEILLCKMKSDRGVFPGQWGLPGGGIEPGERMTEALQRELTEECGILVKDIKPMVFKDGLYNKYMPDGTNHPVYMIFLIFTCTTDTTDIVLNQEFSEYHWVTAEDLSDMDLNIETIDTLEILWGKFGSNRHANGYSAKKT